MFSILWNDIINFKDVNIYYINIFIIIKFFVTSRGMKIANIAEKDIAFDASYSFFFCFTPAWNHKKTSS